MILGRDTISKAHKSINVFIFINCDYDDRAKPGTIS